MEYNRTMSKSSTSKELDKIAEFLKNGGDYNNYEEYLDKILGTGLKERDLEAEEMFERKHREE